MFFEFTNLARARFTGATLNNVNFTGAYTFQTHFESVDLRNTKGLSQRDLEIACGDDKTLLPKGLFRPESWPCKE